MNNNTPAHEQYRAMLVAIIDSSEDAIISKDLNGVITSWNKSAERLFGYTETEAIGQHISLLIPADRQAEEDMIIQKLRAGLSVEHFQTVRVKKSGKSFDISLTISPVRDIDGKVVGASKIARDITKQKEAERQISEHARQLELINATAKALAAEIDIDRILQHVTDTTTRLSGAAFGAFFYNKTDFTGETYMLYALSGASRESFDKFGMPRNTAVFSRTFSGEGILLSDDITQDPRYGHNRPHKGMPVGHLPVVSYLAVPVIAPGGTVIGGLFFGHPEKAKFREDHAKLVESIAGLAALALDKARLYAEVQALNTKKDDFIGFASHELKTPLTTINGYLQLVEMMPDRVGDWLPKVRRQVGRLSAIIADLLDISKIEAGNLELNYVPITLNRLVNDALETVKPLSSRHHLHADMPTEEITVTVDAQKTGQVLINLLTNAIKYSPEGTTVFIDTVQLGASVRISIRDEGIGISAEHLQHIFSRFFRVAESHNKVEGLGVGLYLAKEIVEAHHGLIWVESEIGKGSTFFIELPVLPTGHRS